MDRGIGDFASGSERLLGQLNHQEIGGSFVSYVSYVDKM
jgi:hypothetical protein